MHFLSADLPSPTTITARRFLELWRRIAFHCAQSDLPWEARVGQDAIWGPCTRIWHRTQARSAINRLRCEGFYDR